MVVSPDIKSFCDFLSEKFTYACFLHDWNIVLVEKWADLSFFTVYSHHYFNFREK